MQGDTGRYGETSAVEVVIVCLTQQGDTGRCREIWGDQRGGGGHRLLDEADDDAREDEEAEAVRHADQQVGESRACEGEQEHALPAEDVVAQVADEQAAHDLRGRVDGRDEAVVGGGDAELLEAVDEVRHDQHDAKQVQKDR